MSNLRSLHFVAPLCSQLSVEALPALKELTFRYSRTPLAICEAAKLTYLCLNLGDHPSTA